MVTEGQFDNATLTNCSFLWLQSQLLPALAEEDGISDTSPELPRLLRDNMVPAPTAQAPGVSQLLESVSFSN